MRIAYERKSLQVVPPWRASQSNNASRAMSKVTLWIGIVAKTTR